MSECRIEGCHAAATESDGMCTPCHDKAEKQKKDAQQINKGHPPLSPPSVSDKGASTTFEPPVVPSGPGKT